MPKKKKTYTAIVTIFAKDYKGEGESVTEALQNISYAGVVRDKVVLTIKSGKKEKSRVMPPAAVQRLFSPSLLTREIALKNTSLLFDL
jgi:hypothetical protein